MFVWKALESWHLCGWHLLERKHSSVAAASSTTNPPQMLLRNNSRNVKNPSALTWPRSFSDPCLNRRHGSARNKPKPQSYSRTLPSCVSCRKPWRLVSCIPEGPTQQPIPAKVVLPTCQCVETAPEALWLCTDRSELFEAQGGPTQC